MFRWRVSKPPGPITYLPHFLGPASIHLWLRSYIAYISVKEDATLAPNLY